MSSDWKNSFDQLTNKKNIWYIYMTNVKNKFISFKYVETLYESKLRKGDQ